MGIHWKLTELWSRIRDLCDLKECDLPIQYQLKTVSVSLLSQFSEGRSSFEESRVVSEEAVAISEALWILSDEKLSSYVYKEVPNHWRQLYTDSILLKALGHGFNHLWRTRKRQTWSNIFSDRIDPSRVHQTSRRNRGTTRKKAETLHDCSRGEGGSTPNVINSIPVLADAPSTEDFVKSMHKSPFVIKGYILESRSWRWKSGPRRIGKSYTEEDWSQKIMGWDEFLSKINESSNPDRLIYLAQYNLFNQFPILKHDIQIPEYVDCELPPHDRTRPETEDGVILNVWLGPAGTISPAHVDPYYNCYVQIVGRKYVWIAGPQFQTEMYPFGSTPPTIDRPEEEDQDHDDKETLQANYMTNTSQVDVLGSVEPDRLDEFRTRFPNFVEKVMPEALQIILEEGDMLVMPPGIHGLKKDGFLISYDSPKNRERTNAFRARCLTPPVRKLQSDIHPHQQHLQSPDALARRYKLLEKLGQGNFGVVFKALDRVTGEIVAVKEVDLENSDEDISDWSFLSLVTNTYYLFPINSESKKKSVIWLTATRNTSSKYYGSFVRGYKLWIVMEYLAGGSCLDLLKPGPFPETGIQAVMRELLLGLEYLHAQKKIHRDIKSANILVSSKGKIKLADFGVATQLSNQESRRHTFVSRQSNGKREATAVRVPPLAGPLSDPQSKTTDLGRMSRARTIITILGRIPRLYQCVFIEGCRIATDSKPAVGPSVYSKAAPCSNYKKGFTGFITHGHKFLSSTSLDISPGLSNTSASIVELIDRHSVWRSKKKNLQKSTNGPADPAGTVKSASGNRTSSTCDYRTAKNSSLNKKNDTMISAWNYQDTLRQAEEVYENIINEADQDMVDHQIKQLEETQEGLLRSDRVYGRASTEVEFGDEDDELEELYDAEHMFTRSASTSPTDHHHQISRLSKFSRSIPSSPTLEIHNNHHGPPASSMHSFVPHQEHLSKRMTTTLRPSRPTTITERLAQLSLSKQESDIHSSPGWDSNRTVSSKPGSRFLVTGPTGTLSRPTRSITLSHRVNLRLLHQGSSIENHTSTKSNSSSTAHIEILKQIRNEFRNLNEQDTRACGLFVDQLVREIDLFRQIDYKSQRTKTQNSSLFISHDKDDRQDGEAMSTVTSRTSSICSIIDHQEHLAKEPLQWQRAQNNSATNTSGSRSTRKSVSSSSRKTNSRPPLLPLPPSFITQSARRQTTDNDSDSDTGNSIIVTHSPLPIPPSSILPSNPRKPSELGDQEDKPIPDSSAPLPPQTNHPCFESYS
ncbi:hypothetical protein H4Q26_016267 [Puccinia striiformis f. sp. tritici PST-130]|nr:hypothetical protein H4Q26_016267 [Puccinia striiformis f. sp. tritici PST-130]